jgi:kinetochore protein Mis12/MTW1
VICNLFPTTNRAKSLIDDIINSINHLGYKVIEAVEQGLLGAPLSDLGFPSHYASEPDQSGENHTVEEKARLEIENGVHQFETLIEATIDKNFDKLEVVALRSILAIPEELRDWIRLRDYEVQCL